MLGQAALELAPPGSTAGSVQDGLSGKCSLSTAPVSVVDRCGAHSKPRAGVDARSGSSLIPSFLFLDAGFVPRGFSSVGEALPVHHRTGHAHRFGGFRLPGPSALQVVDGTHRCLPGCCCVVYVVLQHGDWPWG